MSDEDSDVNDHRDGVEHPSELRRGAANMAAVESPLAAPQRDPLPTDMASLLQQLILVGQVSNLLQPPPTASRSAQQQQQQQQQQSTQTTTEGQQLIIENRLLRQLIVDMLTTTTTTTTTARRNDTATAATAVSQQPSSSSSLENSTDSSSLQQILQQQPLLANQIFHYISTLQQQQQQQQQQHPFWNLPTGRSHTTSTAPSRELPFAHLPQVGYYNRTANLIAPSVSSVTQPSAPLAGTAAVAVASEDAKQPVAARSTCPEPFPQKLYRMLQESETEGFDNVVSFTPSGRAFAVHNRRRFLDDIAPLYFHQKNFQSFKRQLNHYGFEVVPSGPDEGAFVHPNFQRGRLDLLPLVRRI